MAKRAGCGRTLIGAMVLLGLIFLAAIVFVQQDNGPPPSIEPQRASSESEHSAADEQVVDAEGEVSAAETEDEPRNDIESAAEAARWRTWTSADGKYSVYAKFVKSTMGTMTLEKEDGSTAEVQLDRLCEEDQEFVRKRPWRASEPRQVGPAAKVVRVRLVPYTTPDGHRTQMLLVDWRNTGTTTIRAVDADITAYDGIGNMLQLFGDSGTINYTIYAVADSSAGIAPGELYVEPLGQGFVLPSVGALEAVRVEVKITEVVESGAY